MGDPIVQPDGLKIFGPQSESLATDLEQLVKDQLPSDWEWVDSSDHTIVCKRRSPDPVYFKAYLSRSILEGIKGFTRGTRCDRAREQSQLLTQFGFHTPTILCWGNDQKRQFMVTEGVPGEPFAKYIHAHWLRPLSRDQLQTQRKIIDDLGREIGRLHRVGIVHGDLRPNNILFDLQNDESCFFFLDNERNRRYPKIPMRLVRKNLVQINMIIPTVITHTDRLRFFKAYNEVYERFSLDRQRQLAQAVQRISMQRLKQKAYL